MRSFGKPAIIAVPVNLNVQTGFTLPYKNIDCKEDTDGKIVNNFPDFPNIKNLRELLEQIIKKYKNNPMFGTLTKEKSIEWITYGEFDDLLNKTVAGMIENDLKDDESVGVMLENCIYYPLAQWACTYIGCFFVPINFDFMSDVVHQIITIFKCTTLICSITTLEILLRIYPEKPVEQLTKIFLFCNDRELARIEARLEKSLTEYFGITVIVLPTMLEKQYKSPLDLKPLDPDTICALNMGTGRCGSLKPCCLTHENIIAAAAGILSCDYKFGQDIYLSSIPMYRACERSMQLVILAHGGSVAFDEDGIDLLDGLKHIRPTIMMTSGDVMNNFFESLVDSAMESNCITRALYDFFYSIIEQARDSSSPIPWVSRALTIDPHRAKVGGRLRLIISSCNYLDARVQRTLRVMLQIPIIQMYGVTEACGVVCIQKISDKSLSVVGAPTNSCEIRIKEFYEMHTRVNAGDHGEIIVKGPNVYKGYYRNQELTDQYLTEDGWFSTGDIGKILPDGSLEIIDTIHDFRRRKRSHRS